MLVTSQVCLPTDSHPPSFKTPGLHILSSAAAETPDTLQMPLNKLIKYQAVFSFWIPLSSGIRFQQVV